MIFIFSDNFKINNKKNKIILYKSLIKLYDFNGIKVINDFVDFIVSLDLIIVKRLSKVLRMY